MDRIDPWSTPYRCDILNWHPQPCTLSLGPWAALVRIVISWSYLLILIIACQKLWHNCLTDSKGMALTLNMQKVHSLSICESHCIMRKPLTEESIRMLLLLAWSISLRSLAYLHTALLHHSLVKFVTRDTKKVMTFGLLFHLSFKRLLTRTNRNYLIAMIVY